MEGIKGFKVFNSDWTCRGFKYEVGKTFEEDFTPVCCVRGFHFCKELKDCFSYYYFDPDNKVAKVVALGEIDEESDNTKCCTNKIYIAEEITWEEVIRMVNIGKENSGLCNTGNRNTGNMNTGSWNAGDHNTGDHNMGDRNTGSGNTGNWNTGNCNAGNCNAGNMNTGNCNTGNMNTGSWNAGDWNLSAFNSGSFNTEELKISLFNRPSDWTYRDWLDSDARYLLNNIQNNIVGWVPESEMTEAEKEANPTYETTGGYLKVLNESECAQMWWDGLSESERDIIMAIPNFDAAIFKQLTGIKAEGLL